MTIVSTLALRIVCVVANRAEGQATVVRIAAVLGLVEQNGGGVGRYGFGDNAQAQVPTLAVG